MKAKIFKKEQLEKIGTILADSIKMNPASKKAWLKRLRSGKYKQGKESLYSKRSKSFCCLGVYCHQKKIPLQMIEGEGLPLKAENWMDSRLNEKDSNMLSKIIGKESTCRDVQNFLAGLNDDGYSFKQIAKVIEKIL